MLSLTSRDVFWHYFWFRRLGSMNEHKRVWWTCVLYWGPLQFRTDFAGGMRSVFRSCLCGQRCSEEASCWEQPSENRPFVAYLDVTESFPDLWLQTSSPEQRHQKAISDRSNLLQMGGGRERGSCPSQRKSSLYAHWYAHHNLNFVLFDQSLIYIFFCLFSLCGEGGYTNNIRIRFTWSPLHLHTHTVHMCFVSLGRAWTHHP